MGLIGVSRLRIILHCSTQRAANVVGVRFSAVLFNATVRRATGGNHTWLPWVQRGTRQ